MWALVFFLTEEDNIVLHFVFSLPPPNRVIATPSIPDVFLVFAIFLED